MKTASQKHKRRYWYKSTNCQNAMWLALLVFGLIAFFYSVFLVANKHEEKIEKVVDSVVDSTPAHELTDAERFCIGLKELAKECNLTNIRYSKMGITIYEFADGSGVGSLRAHREAELIP